ncbi:hypothetical protein BN2475_700079 [Paraburkholderia ribeironis]|uniref:Uncharacterized protein n=1 Tax=Paraburkholderia ribeironis TaxID=1247936 RepID=A0A1N7SI31_9BURK|nr:hypothetical protein [Paraburkholderia ribeironis]SIT46968.1 hypothetical protein BN2475_700079 [Paraburkholderia ribeironis]
MKKSVTGSCRFLIAGILPVLDESSFAQSEADNANKGDSLLNPSLLFNVQNYYAPSVFGVNAHNNKLPFS